METLTVNKVDNIQSYLHFNENSKMFPRTHPDYRVFKIRPLIKQLLDRFKCVPYKACMTVDEQICSIKARIYLKQIMLA